MKIILPLMRALAGLTSFLLIAPGQASSVLTFTPLTKTSISLSNNETAQIAYLVTNQSENVHNLLLLPPNGISQILTAEYCPSPFELSSQQSCVLVLQIVGGQLTENIQGGPMVCQLSNPLQCYQPSGSDALNITLINDP